MTEKGVRPDQPHLAVLTLAPDLGWVQRIGPAQASIIVGPSCSGQVASGLPSSYYWPPAAWDASWWWTTTT